MTAIEDARTAVLEAAADVSRRPTNVGGVEVAADDWSLDERSLFFLERLVHRLKPRGVLELGSGASTVVLAHALSTLPQQVELVTVESDPFHHRRTTQMLRATAACRFVEILPAHIVARRLHGRYVPTYYLDSSVGEHHGLRPGWADLILVDGPPLPLGGREGAAYQALESARTGAVVLLDDSRRDSERGLLSRLLTEFDGSLEIMNMLGFPKGLAAVLVTAHIDRDPA